MAGCEMAGREIERLAAALEECAQALEFHAEAAARAADGSSLPRLRPPGFGMPLSRMARPPEPDLQHDELRALPAEILELAAEFRDVAHEVVRGTAGRGWINSLVGRASRHLDEALLAPVQAAAAALS